MKQKTKNLIGAIAIAAALTAAPVFAQRPGTATSTGAGRNLTTRLQNIVNRADQEITRRTDMLQNLISRINAMVKLSDAEKSNLASAIQSQIDELNSLETKFATDNDLTPLKADVQSITKSYRIFALVVPQGTIMAAADRVMQTASSVQAIGVKLQERISAQASGTDVTAIQTDLSDLNAKTADAIIQAQAAIAEITPLVPDNGSSTQMQANTSTLKDARTKIVAAIHDLAAARKDAGQIVAGLAKTEDNASATATSSDNSGNQ